MSIRRYGVVWHLADIAIAAFIVGAVLTWYGHYYAPFAAPHGPVRWQNLAAVPTLFWLDLRALTNVLVKPQVLALAALPAALVAVFVAIVRWNIPRWLRLLFHAVACLVFVVGSIAAVALFNIRVF